MPSLLTFLLAPSDGRPVERAACVVAWSFVALLTAALFTFAFNQLHYGWNWPAIWAYRQKFVQGWLMTVAISAAALLVSVLIGVVTALARRARFLPLRYAAALYVEAVRGTPLLVQILILFYVVANAVGVENRYVVGVLTLSLFAGAYLAEVVRAGLQALPKGQYEAADAMGLSYWQKTGLIILPQALRMVIPPLVNTFIGFFKDTSLVLIIGIFDLLTAGKTAIVEPAWQGFGVEVYVFVGLIYLVFCFAMSKYSQGLEAELNRHRRR